MKCDACERGDHINCGMQTWCECECDGPDTIDFDPDGDTPSELQEEAELLENWDEKSTSE